MHCRGCFTNASCSEWLKVSSDHELKFILLKGPAAMSLSRLLVLSSNQRVDTTTSSFNYKLILRAVQWKELGVEVRVCKIGGTCANYQWAGQLDNKQNPLWHYYLLLASFWFKLCAAKAVRQYPKWTSPIFRVHTEIYIAINTKL